MSVVAPRLRAHWDGVGVLIAAWVLLVGVLVVPWYGLQDHAHWDRVAWVPFFSPPYRPGDVVLNLLLYLPLGAATATRSGNAFRRALLLAALLSLATEWSQVYSHGRIPSMTDVVANVAGAGAGALAILGRLNSPDGWCSGAGWRLRPGGSDRSPADPDQANGQ